MNRIHYLFLIVFALLACNPEQPLGGWTHYYETTQCADPWEAGQNDETLAANVKSYLNENQIEVEKIRVKSLNLDAVCLACTCAGGQRIDVIADEENGKRLLDLEIEEGSNLRWKLHD